LEFDPMRLRPLVVATAAVLLLQSPASAQATRPAAAPLKAKPAAAKAGKPAVRPTPEWAKMMAEVGAEISLVVDPKAHPGEIMEKLAALKFTPATTALLVKYLGTAKLLETQKITNADGSLTYNYATPNIDQKLESGAQLQFAPLSGVMKTDKAGNAYTATGAMAFMGFADKAAAARAENLTVTADLHRGPYDFWMGTQGFNIEKMSVTPAGKPSAFVANGIRMDVVARNQSNTADFNFDFGIKSLVVMNQDAGALKMRMRGTGIDLAMMRKLTDEAKAKTKAGGDKSKMGEAQVAALFASLAQNGSTLHMDEFSWAYKGHELMIKGMIGFAPNTTGATPQETMKKAEGQLTIRVPVALLKEVARTAAKNMPMGQPGQPVSDQQIEQRAATFGDMAIGKMLGGGFFRMDGEVLISDVVFKAGKITLNGVAFDLPKPAAAPAPKAKQ
jgi:hypothetical protein